MADSSPHDEFPKELAYLIIGGLEQYEVVISAIGRQ